MALLNRTASIDIPSARGTFHLQTCGQKLPIEHRPLWHVYLGFCRLGARARVVFFPSARPSSSRPTQQGVEGVAFTFRLKNDSGPTV